MPTQDPSLIQALQDASSYTHPVSSFRVIETHISWVLLTGQYAYKIKKAVDLGFLDFSTLEKRKFYCEEELRLNRRLAPALYLDVVSITGSPQQPVINGTGEPFEYAVRMAQFDPAVQFDHLLAAGRLTSELIKCFAHDLARFHAAVDRAGPDSPWGNAASVYEPVMENFAQLRLPGALAAESAALRYLRSWCESTHERLTPALERRKAQGFIRECHGDLHLRNITLYDGHPTAFDCLEFDARLRWIDVMSEAAFLVMDLDEHRHGELGVRFLNEYLHHTGDYAGLVVLRFYQVYRALVRAKVESIRLGQAGAASAQACQPLRAYVKLAGKYTHETPRAVLITHGLSGSGKTTLTAGLLPPCGVIRIRSDVERKRLAGLPLDARTHSAVGADLYSRAAGERTYRRLAELAADVIEAGFPVLVDATFLQHEQRKDFRRLAARLHVPFVILDFQATEALLLQRIRERCRLGRDASEATVAVLKHQLGTRDALADDERDAVIEIDSARELNLPQLQADVRARMSTV